MDDEAYGGTKGQAPRTSSEARLQDAGKREARGFGGVGRGAPGTRPHTGLIQASALCKATEALKHHR